MYCNIIEKLSEFGDEIKRLEEALQHSRDSTEERERQLRTEMEAKVGALLVLYTLQHDLRVSKEKH